MKVWNKKLAGLSTFRRDLVSGRVTHYETFRLQTNPFDPKPWESIVRFDEVGDRHYNKVIRDYIYTPHIHDSLVPGGIRLPNANEILFPWEQ